MNFRLLLLQLGFLYALANPRLRGQSLGTEADQYESTTNTTSKFQNRIFKKIKILLKK